MSVRVCSRLLLRVLPTAAVIILLGALVACQPAMLPAPSPVKLKVVAAESFLADMAQNVAGDRLQVATLMPLGLDPHAFEPTPRDVATVADSQVLIVNGAGFEEWLQEVLDNAGGQRQVIEATAGLVAPQERAGDPHFWLDPNYAIRYVENIRDGLSYADPEGEYLYAKNAAAYVAQLKELDAWIAGQVRQIPPERRLIVTNHESFGYFADRYGFTIIGAIVPSVSSGAAPSAQQLAQLIDQIKATGATAIFLETGANDQLANQVAQETGVKVVTDLYTHSMTPADGPAPTYIAMMRHNVQVMVEALQP